MAGLRAFRFAAPLVAVLHAACPNLGEDRVASVTAQGTVAGVAFLDANGSGGFDVQDGAFPGLRVRLLPAGAPAAAGRLAVSGSDGTYRFDGVPVGEYTINADTAGFADTLKLVGPDVTSFTLRPNETVVVRVGGANPTVSVAAARALPAGRRVFVVGVALNDISSFSDTTVSLLDNTAAIRLTRPRSALFVADSVRVRATVQSRAGQPTLDDAFVVASFGTGLIPTAPALTTGAAATAAGGARDAQLVVVRNATVSDTATVQESWQLTVDDGSGALQVLLDRAADARFRPGPTFNADYTVGNKFDIVGVLVPVGGGVWQLKPRSSGDLIKR